MSISITCNCGLKIIINEDSADKKIQCKNCKAVLDSASVFKSSSLNKLISKEIEVKKQNEITCPFCIEKISENSLTCPICQEDLTKNFSSIARCNSCSEKIPQTSKACPFCGEQFNSAFSLSLDQTNILLSEHFTCLNKTHSSEKIKIKRFFAGSIALLCISVFLLIALISLLFTKPFDKEGVQILGVLWLFFACFTTIHYLIDRKARNMQSIKSPIKFFNLFFKCLKDHRVIFSYQSVSPLGKQATTTKLLPFEIINIDLKQYDITTLKGFKKYWRSTLLGAGSYGRIMKIKKIKVIKEFENITVLEIDLNLQSFDIAISVGKISEKATIQKTLLKHNNKWYVAEGEYQGNLDFATF